MMVFAENYVSDNLLLGRDTVNISNMFVCCTIANEYDLVYLMVQFGRPFAWDFAYNLASKCLQLRQVSFYTQMQFIWDHVDGTAHCMVITKTASFCPKGGR